MSKAVYTEVQGQRLKLTNLDKVLFPKAGITKAELVQYYLTMADRVLEYVASRPLTLIRYPDGILGESFYTKNKPRWTPEWMPTYIAGSSKQIDYLVAQNSAHMVWLGNLAAIELHCSNSVLSHIDTPDHFIIDIDPPENSDFRIVVESALLIKEFLAKRGFFPYIMLSGGKGAHVRIPIVKKYSYDSVTTYVKGLMKSFISDHKGYTLSVSREKRENKILLDIYRNHQSNTAIAPYSIRAKVGAPLAIPLTWDEFVEVKDSQEFKLGDGLSHIVNRENPWSDFFEQGVELPLKENKVVPKKAKVDAQGLATQVLYLPMLCSEVKTVPANNPAFIFEIKWDGIRVGIIKNKKEFKIYSRSGRDITAQFPECILRESIRAENAMLDGELVCLDDKGRPLFHDVISRMHTRSESKIALASRKKPAVLYCFDLMNLNGEDVTSKPLKDRKALLSETLETSDHIRLSESFNDGAALIHAAEQMNLEGIIVKDISGPYEPGVRSNYWRKFKLKSEKDCRIIGYTKGKGGRMGLFGALHLAEIDGDEISYLGKVGTGFNVEQISEILDKLQESDVIAKPIEDSIDEENRTIWISVLYGCTVEYSSLSSNGTLREPVFKKIFKLD